MLLVVNCCFSHCVHLLQPHDCNPGVEPVSLALAGRFPEPPGKPLVVNYSVINQSQFFLWKFASKTISWKISFTIGYT